LFTGCIGPGDLVDEPLRGGRKAGRVQVGVAEGKPADLGLLEVHVLGRQLDGRLEQHPVVGGFAQAAAEGQCPDRLGQC
jgi:hypothetical protein